MKPTNTTPYPVHSALLGLDPDFTDLAATLAPELAASILAQGADPAIAADCYDIGAMHGDREGCEEALGRKLTRAEATALEACIRHYLAHPA